MTKEDNIQLVFTAANIILLLPVLIFTWTTHVDEECLNPNIIGGFKLDWKLRGLTDSEEKKQENNGIVEDVWKIGTSGLKEEGNLNMMSISSLVR